MRVFLKTTENTVFIMDFSVAFCSLQRLNSEKRDLYCRNCITAQKIALLEVAI
jgi:hypothetical protein